MPKKKRFRRKSKAWKKAERRDDLLRAKGLKPLKQVRLNEYN